MQNNGINTELIDDEDVRGWDKLTIKYVQENEVEIQGQIYNKARAFSKSEIITKDDVRDMYGELIISLYHAGDYSPEKAIRPNYTLSLKDYIATRIGYCVLTYCTEKLTRCTNQVNTVVTQSDGERTDLFDVLQHKEASNNELNTLLYSLDDICEEYENLLSRYKINLYQILYIRLLTLDLPDKLYIDILKTMNIEILDLKYILATLQKETDVLMDLVKAICLMDKTEAIEILRNYVDCSYSIADTIEIYANRYKGN